MLRRLSLLTAALCFNAAASAATLTFDFETFPGADGVLGTADDTPAYEESIIPLSTEYSSAGLTFARGTLFHDSFFDGNPDNHYISSTNPVGFFSIPVYGIKIDSKSFWDATVNAFDAQGKLIATSTLYHPDQGTTTFEGTFGLRSSQRIYSFSILPNEPNWILNLDNLVLETSAPVVASPVPEPAAALMIPLALAGLAMARRRQKQA